MIRRKETVVDYLSMSYYIAGIRMKDCNEVQE